MPWEQRGQKLVYYRARKVAGRVIREYCGSGERAEAAAREDAGRRAAREAEAQAWREERAGLEAVDDKVVELAEKAEALARAGLLLAGYRRHARGQWRKRRAGC